MRRPNLVTTSVLIAGGLSLSSCIDPYYAGGVSTGVTRYQPGYTVRTLPSGYRTEVISGNRYYFHNGTYYRPRGNSYVVVDRPVRGPHGDRDRDGVPNRFDTPRTGPRGDRDLDGIPNRYDNSRDRQVIRNLPGRHRVVNHRGREYYQVGNTYYQRRGSGYVVVTSPF